MEEIRNKCSKYLPQNFTTADIHTYLDGGFVKDTKIELMDGQSALLLTKYK